MTAMESTKRTKRQQLGDRSREEILDAASELMSAKGYRGTSMSDLAKASGLPVSSIYWHFSSKAGVLAAVMERGAARFFASDAAFVPLQFQGEPVDLLRAVMRQSDSVVSQNPDFLRLFMLLLLGGEGGEAVHRVREEGRSRLRRALQASYAGWGEELANAVADELTDVALALFDGVFIARQANQPHRQPNLVDQMVDSIHALAEVLRDSDRARPATGDG